MAPEQREGTTGAEAPGGGSRADEAPVDEQVADQVDEAADAEPAVAGPSIGESAVDPRPASRPFSPPSPQAGDRAGGRRVPLPAFAVVAVLALVAIAFGGYQWRHAHDLGDHVRDLTTRQQTRVDVAQTAGQFGEALLSYDYRDLAKARDRVLQHATDRFGQEYTNAFGGLEAAIMKLQAVSTATVRSVYLSDINTDTARAVVTVDSDVVSTAAVRRTISSYLDMAMVRQNGQWKIDSVISVGALDQNSTPTGSDTSTTTVPGATTTNPPLLPTPGG